jgi:hypothetical protein
VDQNILIENLEQGIKDALRLLFLIQVYVTVRLLVFPAAAATLPLFVHCSCVMGATTAAASYYTYTIADCLIPSIHILLYSVKTSISVRF